MGNQQSQPTSEAAAETPDMTAQIEQADVVLIDHSNLDAFIDDIGGPMEFAYDVDILTEDETTRGTVEFNIICFSQQGDYGVATQIHQPIQNGESVLDLRDGKNGGFADYIMGLAA